MGRFIERASGAIRLGAVVGARDLRPGLFSALPVFGTGHWALFRTAGTHSFTIPSNCEELQVHVVGGGSGAGLNSNGTPDAANVAGTSSFGVLVSATGGNSNDFIGGLGIGGDVNYSGGVGHQTGDQTGGGGAASPWGPGGSDDFDGACAAGFSSAAFSGGDSFLGVPEANGGSVAGSGAGLLGPGYNPTASTGAPGGQGGGGGSPFTGSAAKRAGCGGGYAGRVLTVNPNDVFPIVVGAGSLGLDGGGFTAGPGGDGLVFLEW